MTKGLIIEGGGMRGVFAAGVLDYLLDAGIEFDNVIGVSAGACHGCSFVSKQRGRAFATNTDYLDVREYASVYNLITKGEFFGVDFVFHKIPEELYPIDNDAFLANKAKFQVVITNCVTGEAEYPEIKDMHRDIDYVVASSSLPFMAKMVEIDGNRYMDGGVSDSIPLKQSIAQGNNKNIVILTRPRDYRKKKSSYGPFLKLKYKKYPGLVNAVNARSEEYNRTLDYVKECEADGSAFVIAPMGPLDLGRLEKNREKLEKAYKEGYYVAEGLGEKLKKYLQE